MRLTEMFPSRFLKPEDVKEPVAVTIERVEHHDISGDGSQEFRYLMFLMELPKPVLLSYTLANNITDVLDSDDTEDWIYSKMVLYEDPYVFIHGVKTGAIRARKLVMETVEKRSKSKPRNGRGHN